MDDWTKWALGILSALIIAGIIAVYKAVAGKADALDLEKIFKERDILLAKALEGLDKDIKQTNGRVDQAIVTIAQAVSKTDLMDKMGSAVTRTDDQDRRVQRDITELKTDLRRLSENLVAVDKKLDDLPNRVVNLERRNERA